MPTYREDLHLGHEVALVETDDIVNGAITGSKVAQRIIDWFHILANAIRNEHINNGAIDARTISDGAVTTPKIAEKAVTPSKISDDFVERVIDPLFDNAREYHDKDMNQLRKEMVELRQLVGSYNKHGFAVSKEFGNNDDIGISQKTLTDALNKIWTKLEDITGEPYSGITMTVTPDYFISEEGCTVHVTAKTTEANGTFEKIQFFINGTLVVEAEDKDYFETDIEITETSVLKCVAKVMGVEYTREKLITHYNSFWLGAGTSYEDIMNVEHVIPITNGMRGAYNVTCADSDNIFVVMSKGLRPGFIRADMNSFEIPFDETTVTINDEEYSVFTSRNTYEAGTYNIDING